MPLGVSESGCYVARCALTRTATASWTHTPTDHNPVGPIRALDIKHGHEPNAPSFAFLEYTDPRDAEDAMRKRDGSDMGGLRLRVEPAKGGHVSTSSRGPPRRGQFRVRVTGLPVSASWQVRALAAAWNSAPSPLRGHTRRALSRTRHSELAISVTPRTFCSLPNYLRRRRRT